MSKPTTAPLANFAADATWTAPGKAWDGTATKVSPTSVQTTGTVPGARLAANHFNWFADVAMRWLTYCKDVFEGAESLPALKYAEASGLDDDITLDPDTPIHHVKTLTADRVWTLPPVVPGQRIWVANTENSYSVTITGIQHGSQSSSSTMTLRYLVGSLYAATLVCDATGWNAESHSVYRPDGGAHKETYVYPDSSSTVYSSTGPVIFVPNQSTNHTCTISTTGAKAGDQLFFVSQQTTAPYVTVTDGSKSMVIGTAAGDHQGGTATFDGTYWQMSPGHQN